MTYGIDTDFIVAAEIRDHPFHRPADALLSRLLADGHDFALAPQTLAEFIHIVTDAKRMPQPLSMSEAVSRAEHWWQAAEVVRVFPDGPAITDFLSWLTRHQLGRKRLLDTLLAASLKKAGVVRVITNNERDYRLFGCFEMVTFQVMS
jgi:predicted nucleic acid-binding protein